MLKKTLRWLLTLIYKVEIKGLDNYKKAGKRVLIISNHTSFLDPLLLGVFLPDDITFAINTQISERWWLKPFFGVIPRISNGSDSSYIVEGFDSSFTARHPHRYFS